MILLNFIVELFRFARFGKLLNLFSAWNRSFYRLSWFLLDGFLDLRLLYKLWTQLGLFDLCITFWFRYNFFLHLNLSLASWLSPSLFLLHLFFFLIILWSVFTSSSSFLSYSLSCTLSLLILTFVSFSILFLLFSTLFVFFFSFNIPCRLNIRMKEEPVSIVNFLLYELDEVLFSFKGGDIKWWSVTYFDFLEIWD